MKLVIENKKHHSSVDKIVRLKKYANYISDCSNKNFESIFQSFEAVAEELDKLSKRLDILEGKGI